MRKYEQTELINIYQYTIVVATSEISANEGHLLSALASAINLARYQNLLFQCIFNFDFFLDGCCHKCQVELLKAKDY